MQKANLSRELSEEQGSRIPDMRPQHSANPGLGPASMIERAAQRLDWTIAFGMGRNTPPGLEEAANPQPRASWLKSSRTGGPWRLLISRLCLAAVVVGVAAGTGILLFTYSAGEKTTTKSAHATAAPAAAGEAASLIRGLAVMPPAASTPQSATLPGRAPTPAAAEGEPKLILGSALSPSVWPQPKVATAPAQTPEPTSTFAPRAPWNQPTAPAFSRAEITGLLARGDWLFATGNIASARLLYERAADAGEARGALRLGETFDPVYLDGSSLRGLKGDPNTAVFWYRHARDLGATGIANRLKKLEAKEERN
jgi:hypothetical protein